MNKLAGKRWVIAGPNESGKSVLAMHMAQSFASSLIVDPLDGYRALPAQHRKYHPQNVTGEAAQDEIDRVVRSLVMGGPTRRNVDLWLVDEANRFFPHGKPLRRHVAWLNDAFRHSGLSWGVICRRPVQLYTDFFELAQWQYFFRLTGRNDLQFVEDLHKGLGDVVGNLKPWHFVERHASTGEWTVNKPVPEDA